MGLHEPHSFNSLPIKEVSKMVALFITGNRNGYSPEQCGKTMTVGDLMEYLAEFDEDSPIYLRNDGGYTYGSIKESDFSESYEDEEVAEDE
jgi:hypothetical protein